MRGDRRPPSLAGPGCGGRSDARCPPGRRMSGVKLRWESPLRQKALPRPAWSLGPERPAPKNPASTDARA